MAKRKFEIGPITVEIGDALSMHIGYHNMEPGYILDYLHDKDGLFLKTTEGYYSVLVEPADGRKIANKFRKVQGATQQETEARPTVLPSD